MQQAFQPNYAVLAAESPDDFKGIADFAAEYKAVDNKRLSIFVKFRLQAADDEYRRSARSAGLTGGNHGNNICKHLIERGYDHEAKNLISGLAVVAGVTAYMLKDETNRQN
ncbi:hypothetical protein PO124_30760 [Bacillus licheniformis]|nr:hypothetical protein [Bacillus licheniformis]